MINVKQDTNELSMKRRLTIADDDIGTYSFLKFFGFLY